MEENKNLFTSKEIRTIIFILIGIFIMGLLYDTISAISLTSTTAGLIFLWGSFRKVYNKIMGEL